MYKTIQNKHFRITFNKFPKTAKQVSKVYHTGIRNWVADDSYNYSLVIGTFRIIFSIDRVQSSCCN